MSDPALRIRRALLGRDRQPWRGGARRFAVGVLENVPARSVIGTS